ncbi:MAG TPA: class I SAM-dependent methyltransferase [Polyangiaceae bacterium]|jgi:SAM-dependent methyltransferase|nr:class I SAM-dependent methyltransferase [Polyangiaceae bacterium]
MGLRERWESQAAAWIAWARRPGHDSYDQFHRDQFFDLVPSPGKLTIDLGCGEGRVARDLLARGHRVVAFDGSPTLVAAAREATPPLDAHVADAASLPLPDACADLVVSHMVLHDVDDLDGAAREIARVLEPSGRLCLAIVHPLNSAGRFEGSAPDAPFRIEGSYLGSFDYAFHAERHGLSMVFHSRHRPLEAYFAAFAAAGLAVLTLREPAVPDAAATKPEARRWQRVPLFLHMLARREEKGR